MLKLVDKKMYNCEKLKDFEMVHAVKERIPFLLTTKKALFIYFNISACFAL